MILVNKPKLKIRKTISIRIMEFLTIAIIPTSFLIPLIFYSELPQKIPIHITWKGFVNRYDEKSLIWLFPILNLILALGLFKLKQHPHLFNYSEKVTKENYYDLYESAIKILSFVGLLIAILFLIITYEIVIVAINERNSINTYSSFFIKVILAVLTFMPLTYLLKRFVKK